MRIVVTGAGGFIGGRLAATLQARGQLNNQRITELVLVDQTFPSNQTSPTPGFTVRRLTGDIRDAGVRRDVFQTSVQAFFHLAATLTAEAERDFDKGLAMNMIGLADLLDDCRRAGNVRFVFSSSMAAFGGQLPDIVPDEIPQRPRTSYGIQKVIAELLLDDYTRRGFLDGRGLRLPVVLLRPKGSAPALSEHITAIVREPLAGQPVVCPFLPTTRMPVASVGAVANALIRLFELPQEAIGDVRTMNLPALSVTVDEMIAAAERRTGASVPQLITWRPDPQLQGLIDAMPKGFTSTRAHNAGIRAEPSFDTVIEDFLAH